MNKQSIECATCGHFYADPCGATRRPDCHNHRAGEKPPKPKIKRVKLAPKKGSWAHKIVTEELKRK